ncbi:hypothetical protein BDV95DRAFT_607444 [Massariosphaeria phaeospora]|uniref:Uncharacterized protein n=1 Tax=Massariosphaeria phaeospora TaxID=100035 RepID=A0A7C8IA49_9PLEO|nr:hypothetical protein BDV95DRAFT_607444 [Massariosphaeria phaeospora]
MALLNTASVWTFPSPALPSTLVNYTADLAVSTNAFNLIHTSLSSPPRSGFGSLGSSLRANDIVEPRWSESVQNEIYSLNAYCLVCPTLSKEDEGSAWGACENYTENPTRNTTAELRDPEADLKWRIPWPEEEESAISVCLFALLLREDLGVDFSQTFLVSRGEREVPYLYNEEVPEGKEFGLVVSATPTSSPIPIATPGPKEGGDLEYMYVIVGALLGTGLISGIVYMAWRFLGRRNKTDLVSEKTGGEEASIGSKWDAKYRSPPPAYHEIVVAQGSGQGSKVESSRQYTSETRK